MTDLREENERTLTFAEIALGQMRSLRHSAIPRNYEIWYAYATGYNPELNKTINEKLSRNGKLTEDDLEQIYESYLSQIQMTDHIDKVGSRVVDEIDDVMVLIIDALGMTTNFGDSLESATKDLTKSKDQDQIKSIVETMVTATRKMHVTNKALESRLTKSRQEISLLQKNLEAIRKETLTDHLTSLGNRKYFDKSIQAAIAQAHERQEPLSLVMIDIDHFKSFNDNHGHLTGDQVLRLVGFALKQSIKGQDLAARYGGEEFVVILPNTPLRHALTVADNICRAVMSKQLKKKSTGEIIGRITISAGVSMLRADDDAHTLIERADCCLYAAKNNGRNRAICEEDPQYNPNNRTQVA